MPNNLISLFNITLMHSGMTSHFRLTHLSRRVENIAISIVICFELKFKSLRNFFKSSHFSTTSISTI